MNRDETMSQRRRDDVSKGTGGDIPPCGRQTIGHPSTTHNRHASTAIFLGINIHFLLIQIKGEITTHSSQTVTFHHKPKTQLIKRRY